MDTSGKVRFAVQVYPPPWDVRSGLNLSWRVAVLPVTTMSSTITPRLSGLPVEIIHVITPSNVKSSVTVHVRLYKFPETGSPSLVIIIVGGGGTSAEVRTEKC